MRPLGLADGLPVLAAVSRGHACLLIVARESEAATRSRISVAPPRPASCDVYDVGMVRKQLYISDEQERALKAKARELGVSEAELVRRMLDGLLLGGEVGRTLAGSRATEALDGFLEGAERLSSSHSFPEGYAFDRDELYEERA